MNPQAQGPVLRDIHLPEAPGWWPPAPGWWILAALLLLGLLLLWRLAARRRRARGLRARLQQELALALELAADPATRVASMSHLLRRAARRFAPSALTLRDEPWLQFLDGDDPARPFSTGAGRLLLDGPYRAHVDAAEVDALATLVHARLPRFVERADA